LGFAAVGVTVCWKAGLFRPHPSHAHQAEAVVALADLLRGWHEELEETDARDQPRAVMARFTELLSRRKVDALLTASPEYSHPYFHYLRQLRDRLPPESVNVPSGGFNIPDLVAHFKPLVPELPAEATPQQFVDAVRAAVSYDSWRRKTVHNRYHDLDKLIPGEVKKYVERFRRQDRWVVEAARLMVSDLRKWEEPAAAAQLTPEFVRHHPFRVCDRYFAVLCRAQFRPDQLKFDHPEVAFVLRLPEDPVGQGSPLDSEEDLRQALRQLLGHLVPDYDPTADRSSTSLLVRRIRDEMSYAQWRDSLQGKRVFEQEGSPPDPEISRFLGRFRR
jgi:hypothetical protein